MQAGGTLARCLTQGRGIRRIGHVPRGCRNSCHRKHTALCPLLSSSAAISEFVNSVVALNVSNCLRHLVIAPAVQRLVMARANA